MQIRTGLTSAVSVIAFTLVLSACGDRPRVLDGTPHAASIQPTVAVPPAAAEYRSVQQEASAEAGMPLGAEDASDAVAPAQPDATAMAAEGEASLAPTAPATRLSERGFFGIVEPIRRAERPAAQPAQPRQPTQEELQQRARADALASIVGQFDGPSTPTRMAPAEPEREADGPRIADVPDRPADAPTPEELANLRAQLESGRDRGLAAQETRSAEPVGEAVDESAPADPAAMAGLPAEPAPEDPAAMTDDPGESAPVDPAAMAAFPEGAEPSVPGEAEDGGPAQPPSLVTIPFNAGETGLSAESQRMVRDLGSDSTLSGSAITVIGYATEDDGGASTAQQRADAVAALLRTALSEQGISAAAVTVESRLGSEGAGADDAARVDISIED